MLPLRLRSSWWVEALSLPSRSDGRRQKSCLPIKILCSKGQMPVRRILSRLPKCSWMRKHYIRKKRRPIYLTLMHCTALSSLIIVFLMLKTIWPWERAMTYTRRVNWRRFWVRLILKRTIMLPQLPFFA